MGSTNKMLIIYIYIYFFSSEGDENNRNISDDLLGSPPKLSRPSPRKLGFDENSPVAAHQQPPVSPSLGATTQSANRQETPTNEARKTQKKPPVTQLFGESEELRLPQLFFFFSKLDLCLTPQFVLLLLLQNPGSTA